MELFRNRCPKCRKTASTVHELEPRSRGAASMRMQNRTAICSTCHAEFHRQGASDKNIREWKELIKTYLTRIGNYTAYEAWGVGNGEG